jgi:hypothetical protein
MKYALRIISAFWQNSRSYVPNRILPEFQDFLLSRSLVPAKNAPFYAHWVGREAEASPTHPRKDQSLKIRTKASLLMGD